jgi:hypothetical protein
MTVKEKHIPYSNRHINSSIYGGQSFQFAVHAVVRETALLDQIMSAGLCLLNTKPIAEDVQFLLCSTKETEHLLNISYMPYNYTFQVSP